MRNEKKTEIKVGLTVFVALLLFIFVYGWAKNFSLNSDEKKLTIEFPTVAGLEIGDLVSVNGVRKGLVNSITSDNNFALVDVKFSEDVNLKEDASFYIMMLDLMGGKKIEISAGNSSNKIDFIKVHKGKFAGDISTAMATLHSVETDLLDVVYELKNSLKSANSILSNEKFANDLTTSVSNLNTLTGNLNKMILNNREVLEETLLNARELTSKTNTVLDDNSNRIKSILNNFDSTLVNSNILITKVTNISDDIINSNNNLGKALNNEELLTNLEESLKQIKEMTTIINKQLKSGGLEVKADVDLF